MSSLRDEFDIEVADLPALGDVDAALAQVASERRAWRRAGLVAVAAAAVVALLALGVRPLVKSHEAPDGPADSPTPTASHSSVTVPVGPFAALATRGTTLIAIDGSGHERTLRDLAPLGISPYQLQSVYVSSAGWLVFRPGATAARSEGIGFEFVNLLDPRTKPVMVRGGFDQATWSPDGTRLASTESAVDDPTLSPGGGNFPVIIDAATGAKTALDQHGLGLPGEGPSVIWTADGSGIVVSVGGGLPNQPVGALYVAPVDSGPLQSTIPALWERDRHSIAAGGLLLEYTSCYYKPCPAGKVVVADPSGIATTLYDGDLPGTTLIDATLRGDGRSALLLLANGAPNQYQIGLSDGRRQPRVLTTVTVTANDGAALGVSPDDSALLLTTFSNPDGPSPTSTFYLVPMDGRPASVVQGSFAGWVPTAVVDDIAARS